MKYHPSYAARVRDMCYVGATNTEIATLLGISVNTLREWREQYPEFNFAWREGQAHADAKVAASLFKRATGYEAIKWKDTKDGRQEELVIYPPDVTACIFWLTNRRPENWEQRVEHKTPAGGIIPTDNMSQIEAARRIAFALSKAMYLQIEEHQRSIENGSGRTIEPETE